MINGDVAPRIGQSPFGDAAVAGAIEPFGFFTVSELCEEGAGFVCGMRCAEVVRCFCAYGARHRFLFLSAFTAYSPANENTRSIFILFRKG